MVTAGIPLKGHTLPLNNVRGMKSGVLNQKELKIPPCPANTRSGGISRDVFLSRFTHDYCVEHSGIRVFLRRVEGGDEDSCAWIHAFMVGKERYSSSTDWTARLVL